MFTIDSRFIIDLNFTFDILLNVMNYGWDYDRKIAKGHSFSP